MGLKPKQLKYKIKEIMDRLTVVQHDKAMNDIPVLIKKCKNTFKSYMKIPLNSGQEMPYDVGWIIEEYFALPPRGLYNVKMQCKCLYEKDKPEDGDQSSK